MIPLREFTWVSSLDILRDIDWNLVERNLVPKIAEILQTRRKEHVDTLCLRQFEELVQEYDGIYPQFPS